LGDKPADWRSELHYEYDFRDIFYSEPQKDLGLAASDASLCVIQDDHYKYVHVAALPPLFFNLREDPGQLSNRASDSSLVSQVKDYAQKALSWRLRHADRSLTHYRSSPQGLAKRDEQGRVSSLRTRPITY
jgi:arylsulfatase A-like enzyme